MSNYPIISTTEEDIALAAGVPAGPPPSSSPSPDGRPRYRDLCDIENDRTLTFAERRAARRAACQTYLNHAPRIPIGSGVNLGSPGEVAAIVAACKAAEDAVAELRARAIEAGPWAGLSC